MRRWIVADIDLCIGCHACEVACKQENELLRGPAHIRVYEAGPYRIGGRLAMDFIPMASSDHCPCVDKLGEGSEPLCVSVCPTSALLLVDERGMLEEARSGRRLQILNIAEAKARSA